MNMDVNIEILPDECLMIIFNFIPSPDLFSVAQVSSRFWNLTNDREIVRNLDLRHGYKCSTEDFRIFFFSRARCIHTHYLNVDHVYWIKLPSIVMKLKNLEELNMMGTSMTYLQLKGILKSCTKIRKLSVNWPDDYTCSWDQPKKNSSGFDDVASQLAALESLRLLVYSNPTCILELLSHCFGLKKLVLTNHHAFRNLPVTRFMSHRKISLQTEHLQDLVIDISDRLDTVDFSWNKILEEITRVCQTSADWKMYWVNVVPEWLTTPEYRGIVRKCSSLFMPLNPITWQMLIELGTLPLLEELLVKGRSPQPIKFSSQLHCYPNLKSLRILFGLNLTLDLRRVLEALPKLEKLCICCQPESGPPVIVGGLASLRYLTHLTVPACALIEVNDNGSKEVRVQEKPISMGFKQKRIGLSSSASRAHMAAFNHVFNNCPHLVMLEIGFNSIISCSPAKVQWECLENIKKLKKLTHVTLDGIPITDGKFFIEMAKGCPKLEFLRLRNLGPSGKCCYISGIAEALRLFNSLRHLRIEQNYLAPGISIFKALEECKKLERVFISSERDSLPFNLEAVDGLIAKSPSLLFFFVVGGKTTKDNCMKCSRKYKKSSRPALVVRIRNTLWDVFEDNNHEICTIPACHYNEMVTFRSWAYDSYL